MPTKEICIKAISGGYTLVKNGRKKRKHVGLCQEFVCNRPLLYKKSKFCKKDEYRITTFNNNRKNSRGKEGKSMPRQVTTLRPMPRDRRCKFGF